MTPLRALGLAALVAAAPLWILPSAAFSYADASPRAVVATVVSDGSAYLTLTSSPCTPSNVGGGSCTFTITNKDVKEHAYAVTKMEDDGAAVDTYQVTGGTTVEQGATTSGSVGIGSSVTLTANLETCVPICSGQKTVTWKVEARSGGESLATKNAYSMSIQYG